MGSNIKPYSCIKPELAYFLKLSSKLHLSPFILKHSYDFNVLSNENK